MTSTLQFPSNTSVLIQPVYYDQFFCIASDCPDSCCKGWTIVIDSRTVNLWKSKNGIDLENCISKVQSAGGQTSYRIRMNANGHCPLLTSDELCSVYLHIGEHSMPDVCRQFPRSVIESESITQRYVSVRCPAVLDLLWANPSFQYKMFGCSDFPAKKLLDFFLDTRQHGKLSSSFYLSWIFHAIYHIHSELSLYIPYESDGYRAFGQELITEDSVQKTICAAQKACAHDPYGSSPNLSVFETYHEMLSELTENFLDHPVFGTDFSDCLSASQQLIQILESDPANTLCSIFSKYTSFEEIFDRQMKLVLEEQLFSSIFTVQMTDYESVLLALQWLIVQYTAIRYMLLIDISLDRLVDRSLLQKRINRIFRISDIADLGKLSFFDSRLRNWLWTPAKVDELLGIR